MFHVMNIVAFMAILCSCVLLLKLIAPHLMKNAFLQTVAIVSGIWFRYLTVFSQQWLSMGFPVSSRELMCYQRDWILHICAAIIFAGGIFSSVGYLASIREKKWYEETKEMVIALQREKETAEELRITLSQQAKKHEEEIRTLQDDLEVLDEYAINLEEIKIPSLSRDLEEQKRKFEDLELKARKKAVIREIEILASQSDIEALEEYIENLQQRNLKDEIDEQRLKNKQIEDEHMQQIAQYEDGFDVLARREELQNKYIMKLESAVFKMKKDVKRLERIIFNQVPDSEPLPHSEPKAASTKSVSFVEEVHVFVFSNQLPTNTIEKFQQHNEVTGIGLDGSKHGDSFYKLLKGSVVSGVTAADANETSSHESQPVTAGSNCSNV
ncbi:hypothetical protein RUND412_005625 [Rhizina undulata]